MRLANYIYLCCFIALLLNVNNPLSAQKKVTVTAKGSYVSRDLTPEQTRAKAIQEAKKNALLKAGISENIMVTDFLYTFEDNEKFQEIFQAFTSTETGGEIIVDKILSENRSFDEHNNMIVDIEIQATVFKHKKKNDPALQLKVDGIDQYYNDQEYLKFSVTPSLDGFLKIFNITDDTSHCLYPYKDPVNKNWNDDPGFRLNKYETLEFPFNPVFDQGYYLGIDNPRKEVEFNLLIFVFSVKNIPFMEDETVKDIMKWIYTIPPDERVVVQYGFIIKK